MKKKYLMSSMAVLALGWSFSGCSGDNDYSKTDIINNAQNVLGVTIDPNNDWDMTSKVAATVTVGLGLDQTYTVAIYDENPLFNKSAVYYVKSTVKEGESSTLDFSVPQGTASLYVAVYDSQFRSVVKSATLVNGQLTADFGDTPVTRGLTRAVESASVYPDYVKTATDYLNPAKDKWGNVLNTQTITEAQMQQYTPFTNSDLEAFGAKNSNRTLTDAYTVSVEGHTEGTPGHNVYDENGNWLYWDPGDEHYVNGYQYQEFFNQGDGKHYRVPAGENITTKFNVNGTYGVYNDVVIYVQGTLHLNGNTLNGPTLVVANGGEIVIDGNTSMSNVGRFVVLKGGKLTGANKADLYDISNGSFCYNAGTIDIAGTLNVNGTDFYNSADGVLKADVLKNTASGKFTNFGKVEVRTNTIDADAYNCQVINGCYMSYKESAGVGNLTMLENSRLDVGGELRLTGRKEWGYGNVMYNASVIKAGSIYFENGDIDGPTASGSFAIVKTPKILVSHDKDGLFTGNLYFDWNSDECYSYSNENYKQNNPGNNYIYTAAYGFIGHIPHFTEEETSIFTIPAGDCTGAGYHTTGGGGSIGGSPAIWTYAFEDTYMGDYDMNDVVIKVWEDPDDSDKIVVKLCCTGASMDLKVYLGNTELFNRTEVHAALGGAAGKFINTGSGNEKFADGVAAEYSMKKPSGFTFETADFNIGDGNGEKIHLATAGEGPHAIRMLYDWEWPMEWVPITEAYPNFAAFAADASQNEDWYKYPEASKVYGR